MNAIEFVREHGVGYTRGLVARLHINDTFNLHKGGEVAISDLKEIVEAFELVENCNGLENSKELLEEIRSDEWVYDLCTNTVIHSNYVLCEAMCIRYGLLKQAINLVEQCNAKS